MMKITLSSTNSSRFLHFARVLCNRPALSMFSYSSKFQRNCNTKVNGIFTANSVEQKQFNYTRNYTTGLPSISCKDLSKKPTQDFNFNVVKHCLVDGLNKTPQMNLLCSPASSSAILNMLIPGSKGQTLDQFVDLLGLKEDKLNKSSLRLLDNVKPFEGGVGTQISVCNGVWVDQQYPLSRSYKEVLDDVHAADVKTVDFMCKADEVMEEINQWSKAKTDGMIKTILPETSYYNDTVMVLANALHFKLECSDETMNHVGEQCLLYYCGNYEGSEVLRMPFKGDKASAGEDPRSFSMYIFVPSEKSGLLQTSGPVKKQKISLSEYVREMKVDTKAFQQSINRQKEEISNIVIPNFNIESEISLSNMMQNLGLTLPFKAAQHELMRFVDSPLSDLLYVTDITQKTRIKTSKSGTSFSVVTYSTLNGPPHLLPPTSSKLKFVADNPFLFMIQEDFSSTVVSIGTMRSTSLSNNSLTA